MILIAPLLITFYSATPAPASVAPPAADVRAPEVSVPFGCGLSFPVSQAHSTGSHLFNDVWAWDFRMPEGTPIVAAKEGVVRLARGDSTVGGCDPDWAAFANYVVIAHADGLETQYLHFHEVVVKPGDRVKAGDLIGYSGQTGWACGAHLHFKVARTTGRGWNNPSVPARLIGYGDPTVEQQVLSPACTGRPMVAEKQTLPKTTPLTDRVLGQEQDTARGASAPLPSITLAPMTITGVVSEGATLAAPPAIETANLTR